MARRQPRLARRVRGSRTLNGYREKLSSVPRLSAPSIVRLLQQGDGHQRSALWLWRNARACAEVYGVSSLAAFDYMRRVRGAERALGVFFVSAPWSPSGEAARAFFRSLAGLSVGEQCRAVKSKVARMIVRAESAIADNRVY